MNDENTINELAEIRKQISSLDHAGMDLLKQRLSLSKKVGLYKKKSGAPVQDPAREAVVIDEAQKLFDPAMRHKVESIMSTVMRISRENQYEILMEHDLEWLIGAQIRSAAADMPVPETIAFQGTLGSYSHLAAVKLFPSSALIPAATFDEACFKVLRGECAMAILPLENTTAGTVDDVVSLLDSEPIHIARTVSIPILHKLLLLPCSDIRQVRTVLSHPQALAQCSKFIKKAGWNPVAVENTAFAASRVRELNDPSCCAIASGEAALLNGLEVSMEPICDSIHNQTRFAVISSRLVITQSAERISIIFRLAHQTGSLAYVLNLFAEWGLNLTKIQSRPVPDRPWEYSFWVDLVARRGDPDAMLALYQLSRELPSIKLLGWYEETAVTDGACDESFYAKECVTP